MSDTKGRNKRLRHRSSSQVKPKKGGLIVLSIPKYAALSVLCMEVFYVICLGYGCVVSDKARELHHSLFELIPGFVWGNPISMAWGAVLFAIFAWIAGSYIAWMHNASMVNE